MPTIVFLPTKLTDFNKSPIQYCFAQLTAFLGLSPRRIKRKFSGTLNRSNYHKRINEELFRFRYDVASTCVCSLGVVIAEKQNNKITYTIDDISKRRRRFEKTESGISEFTTFTGTAGIHETQKRSAGTNMEHPTGQRHPGDTADVWWKKCNLPDPNTLHGWADADILPPDSTDEGPDGVDAPAGS